MKLGEALTLRARQSQKLNDFRGRIASNVLVQEGDEPSEDVESLLAHHNTLSAEHAALIMAINTANVNEAILDMIVTRDHLRRKLSALRAVVSGATTTPFSYSRTEIKWTPLVDVALYQGMIEDTESEINVLDVKLQEVNWQVEL